MNGGTPVAKASTQAPGRPDRQARHRPHATARGHDDVVAHRHRVDPVTDRVDDPGRLVTEHDGRRHRRGAVEHVEVAVADARGEHLHAHLARPGIAHLDVVGHEQAVTVEHRGPGPDHAAQPTHLARGPAPRELSGARGVERQPCPEGGGPGCGRSW